jgi:hypothetical protein
MQVVKIYSIHWSHPTKGSFKTNIDKVLDGWTEDKLQCTKETFEKGAVIDNQYINDPTFLQKYLDENVEHITSEMFDKNYIYNKEYDLEALRIRADIFICVESKGWEKI